MTPQNYTFHIKMTRQKYTFQISIKNSITKEAFRLGEKLLFF